VASDPTSAAIRRATINAQHAIEQLDASSAQALIELYQRAADDVEAAIRAAAAAGGTGQVEVTYLATLREQLAARITALGQARDDLIMAGIQQAAELGVRPLTAEGIAATGRAAAEVLSATQALELVGSTVSFVRTFREADGLNLSDRLWRVDSGAKEAVQRAVEQAVVQGWGADKAAAEFAYRGQPVPASTAEAQKAADVDRVVRAGDVLRDTKAGPLASSLRVMRTEINRAHGEGYMAGAAQAPGFVGFKYLLSPMHPRPDICNLLSTQNLYGLGKGVYPTRELTPWPAHPNTLSFVNAVFEEQITPADREGRETTLEALQRLAPEIREGVLGPTKADYFDKGLLSKGMVRATVGSTQARLKRRGLLPSS
jgi:hypothetical protein